MKECPICKAKNENEALFCCECGADLRGISARADKRAAEAGDFYKSKESVVFTAGKARDNTQKRMENADGAKEQRVRKPANEPVENKNVFVEEDEQVVAAIGSGYLQNFLNGRRIGKSIGVLTQKRFYFKGRNFSDLKATAEEGVVDLEDIVSCRFTYIRHIGFLIIGFILALLSVVCLNPDFPIYYKYRTMVVVALLVVAVVFFIEYIVNRQTLFFVSFPGGSFGFDMRYYSVADARNFQRQLYLQKDKLREARRY